jgi:putative spermidine/putrescine transport system substrate-binding protein
VEGHDIRVGILGATWTDRLSKAVKPELDANHIAAEYLAGGAVEWLPRLLAARGQVPPVDVVEVDDQTTPDLRSADLLVKLDPAKIPNLKELDPSLHDDYRVAYWVADQALLYNVDKFRAAGIPAPTRYTDLADPRLRGRVLLPDISHYSSTFVLLALAYENGGSESNLKPGFDLLQRIQPHSYTASAAPVVQLFQAGDVWASPFSAHIAVRLSDAGLNIAVVHPKVEGRSAMISHGYLAIPKGSRDPDAANRFINAAIAAQVQKKLYDDTAIIPVNTIALDAALAEKDVGRVPRSSLEALDAKVIATGWAPDFARLDRRDFAQRWQRAIDAQSR